MRLMAAVIPAAVFGAILYVSSLFGRTSTVLIVTGIVYLSVAAGALILWKRSAANPPMRTAGAWVVAMCGFFGVWMFIGELAPLLIR